MMEQKMTHNNLQLHLVQLKCVAHFVAFKKVKNKPTWS
jgi:hypothetical protein